VVRDSGGARKEGLTADSCRLILALRDTYEDSDWLKTFIPEVPVQWIPAGDPFWRP
jgi:hypothetical protein